MKFGVSRGYPTIERSVKAWIPRLGVKWYAECARFSKISVLPPPTRKGLKGVSRPLLLGRKIKKQKSSGQEQKLPRVCPRPSVAVMCFPREPQGMPFLRRPRQVSSLNKCGGRQWRVGILGGAILHNSCHTYSQDLVPTWDIYLGCTSEI